MNMLWRISPQGGNYLSEKAKTFYSRTSNIILSTRHTRFAPTDRIAAKITLHRGDRRRYDIDNQVKAIFDALVRGAVMTEDSQIDLLHVERGDLSPPDGFCIVELTKL